MKIIRATKAHSKEISQLMKKDLDVPPKEFSQEFLIKFKKHAEEKNILKEFDNPLTMGSNITTINFKTLIELDDFYFDLFENSIKNSLKKRMIFCLKHNWRPLLYPHKERELIKKSPKQYYFVIEGKTSLDKWCSNFEAKSEAKTKMGSNYMVSCDLYIIGDMIIQIYLPKELAEKINSLFMYSKKGNLDINKIIQDIFEKKSKIVVIINKNEELARQMRHQAVDIFNKKSK